MTQAECTASLLPRIVSKAHTMYHKVQKAHYAWHCTHERSGVKSPVWGPKTQIWVRSWVSAFLLWRIFLTNWLFRSYGWICWCNMICANKKMISLTDVQKISISDLNRSGTIVSEMVKCGANLVLEWKVEFSQKFVHHPKQQIWSQTFIYGTQY